MAAGLGFKDFVTGEVLTAADVDGYLMQGVWVFASAAARDAAVTSPQEGNFAYLKDTNVTTYYTGSAWANLDTTGMTNPMTTTGDTIYSSSGSTPARLGIGSTGQVLTVAGGVPSWATPASGGGMTLLDTVTLSGSSVTSSTFSSAYKRLFMHLHKGVSSSMVDLNIRYNTDTGSNYTNQQVSGEGAGVYAAGSTSRTSNLFGLIGTSTDERLVTQGFATVDNPSNTDTVFTQAFSLTYDGAGMRGLITMGAYNCSAAITSITFLPGSGTFTSGTIKIYGVN
jgi:hypothetical protein